MAAWYTFARLTDDLGDGEESELAKRERLAHWRKCVDEIFRLGRPPDRRDDFTLLWPALVDTVDRFCIPVNLLDDIIVGVQMDVGQVSFSDWPQLYEYCYHVASAVGIACTHIWEAQQPLPVQFPIDCGIAFQLTNILRDVREDAQRARIYVPTCELERFDCQPSGWLKGEPNGDWQGCIEAIAQRAAQLYASGWSTAEYLPTDSRKMFSLIWRTYYQLLEQVVKSKDQLWTDKRIVVPKRARWRLAVSHFAPWWYRQLPDPCQSLNFNRDEMLHERTTNN